MRRDQCPTPCVGNHGDQRCLIALGSANQGSWSAPSKLNGVVQEHSNALLWGHKIEGPFLICTVCVDIPPRLRNSAE